MALDLYIEDNEAIPAIIIQQDTESAPSGFTKTNTVTAWAQYGSESVGDYLAKKLSIKAIFEATAGANEQ